MKVVKNEGRTNFDKAHPIRLQVSERQAIALDYEQAYRLTINLLAHLRGEGQVQGYRVTTKAYSELNDAVTKGW